jgi:hypothetical protein
MSGNGNEGIYSGMAGLKQLGTDETACRDMLREALELAEEGKIKSVGVIVCFEDGLATVMAGKRAGDLFLGAACLQNKIREAVEGGNISKSARKSSILRVP